MRHNYLLCFTEAVPLQEVEDAFAGEDFPVAVLQVMPNAFALASDLSPSKLSYALVQFYSGADHIPVPARSYTLAIAKTGSGLDTRCFSGWPAAKPE